MAFRAVGLKTHIWNNNLKSMALLGFYPVLIGLICWVIAWFFGYSFSYGAFGAPNAASGVSYANNVLFAYWPTILTVIAMWFVAAYFLQTKMVRALSRAHPATRQEEPELYNLLENLCISRGLPIPRLEIIETHARNAFASGVDRRTYTVTVTRGLMQSLDRDELEAVLAHELTHIMNNDVRLLIVSVIFTGMIGFAAQMAWNFIRFNIYVPRGGRRGDGRIIAIAIAVALILWLGYIATLFTRFALSRRREYMADAGAVELTKNPEAMMRALLRLSGKDQIPEATDDIAMMCVENSRKFLGLFATHPPMDKRIAAISQMTNTPVPALTPGRRADDAKRFTDPAKKKRTHPWLTAQRPGRIFTDPWGRK